MKLAVIYGVYGVGFDKFIVSRSLAHNDILLSSPASVGIFPSNRTLVVGLSQLDSDPSLPVTFEQSPTGDDPFTDTVSAVGKRRFHRTTIRK